MPNRGHILWKRAWSVQVDTLQTSGLDISFTVTKSLKFEPNTMDLVIRNLSPDSRAAMQTKGAAIILQAGYDGNVSQIFSGKARTIDHEHKGPDVITRIQAGDAEQEFQFGMAKLSYTQGVSVQTVAAALAQAIGVGTGNLSEALSAGNFPGGLTQFKHYSYHGPASKELTRLLKTLGFQFSVQDGQIQVLQPDLANKDAIYLLTPDTGLLDSPQHGAPDRIGQKSMTLKAKTLLLPELRCGRRVQIRTGSIKGAIYVIGKVKYIGDSAGEPWWCELELRPLGSNLRLGL